MLEQYKDFLRSNDFGLLLLRVNMGGMMLFHGVHKLIGGVDGIAGMLSGMGMPEFLAYGVLMGEVLFPLMLLLGLWTRAAAAGMVVNMIVAILMAHTGDIFSVNATTGGWAIELPMLYLLGAAALGFTGGGRYAVTKGTIFD